TVNAVDSTWNVLSTNDTVAISSSDANGVVPTNAALGSGSQTFSVTLKTAGNPSLTVSDVTHSGIVANTSPVALNAGAFSKLQLLVLGETAVAGSASGKTGAPIPQSACTAFVVTVNAVD